MAQLEWRSQPSFEPAGGLGQEDATVRRQQRPPTPGTLGRLVEERLAQPVILRGLSQR